MEYFDSIVLAVATLMEPLLASFIAVACHAGLLVSNLLTVKRRIDLVLVSPSFSLERLAGLATYWLWVGL